MNTKTLNERLNEIKKNLDSKPSKFESFQTKFGQEFEENFKDLTGFVTNIGILQFFMETISNIIKNITSKAKKEVRGKMREIVEQSEESPEKIDEIEKKIDEAIKDDEKKENSFAEFFNVLKKENIFDRINSYFFLTFYTYIDLYTISLYQHVISKIDVTKVYDVIDGFKPSSNPSDRLKQILKKLELKDKKNLYEKLDLVRNFESDFINFIKLRNSIAHREPLTTYQTIKKNFPKIAKKAKKINEKQSKKTDLKELENHINRENMIQNFEILTALNLIAVNCYILLAMVDYLIIEFFKENQQLEI